MSLFQKAGLFAVGISFLFLMFVFSMEPCEAGDNMVTLIGPGLPAPVIIHSNEKDLNENPLALYAALDLQRYLEKVTGKNLEIGNEDAGAVSIHVGRTRYVESLHLELDSLEWDGFIIATRIRNDVPNLIISGRTALGTYYGVNYFLREHAGINWLFPGKLGEIVPRKETMKAPLRLDDRQEPDFLPLRRLAGRRDRDEGASVGIYGLRNLTRTADRGDFVRPDETNPHPAFNPKGGYERIRGSHQIYLFLPPSMYDTNPEYFPLIDGERLDPRTTGRHIGVGWQPCMSNPDLPELAINAARKYLDENPDAPGFSLGENDSGGYCECEDCRALDTDRRRWASDLCRNYANRKWQFYVEVAEAILESHPDKLVGVYAYLWSALPPDDPEIMERIPPNIAADKTFSHTSDRDKFKEWSGLGIRLGTYDYLYDHFTLDFRHYINHWAEEMRWRYRRGARFYRAEQYGSQVAHKFAPKNWIMQRLLWDINADVDTLMDEYCRLAYGAAAGPMREFWDRWEEIWMRRPDDMLTVFGAYFGRYQDLNYHDLTLADIEYLDRRMARARAAADTEDDSARVEKVGVLYDLAAPPLTLILKTRDLREMIETSGNINVLFAGMRELERSFSEYSAFLEPDPRAPDVPGYIPCDVENALHDAASRITALLVRTRSSDRAVGWWESRASRTPRLKAYADSQLYMLQNPQRENLISNPGFAMEDGEVGGWVVEGLEPEIESSPEKGKNAVVFGGFVTEDRALFSTNFHTDVPGINSGRLYRASINIKNLIDNENRTSGWADKARALFSLIWLSNGEPMSVPYESTARVWEAVCDWENIHVVAEAPEGADGARISMRMVYYLGERDYLDLAHEERISMFGPRLERISR